jgi:hypothetical protein
LAVRAPVPAAVWEASNEMSDQASRAVAKAVGTACFRLPPAPPTSQPPEMSDPPGPDVFSWSRASPRQMGGLKAAMAGSAASTAGPTGAAAPAMEALKARTVAARAPPARPPATDTGTAGVPPAAYGQAPTWLASNRKPAAWSARPYSNLVGYSPNSKKTARPPARKEAAMATRQAAARTGPPRET